MSWREQEIFTRKTELVSQSKRVYKEPREMPAGSFKHVSFTY